MIKCQDSLSLYDKMFKNKMFKMTNDKMNKAAFDILVCTYRIQGSYRQDCVKFKEFSRTSKRLSYSFQGLKVNEKYRFKC